MNETIRIIIILVCFLLMGAGGYSFGYAKATDDILGELKKLIKEVKEIENGQ